jgi:hypothetical protein
MLRAGDAEASHEEVQYVACLPATQREALLALQLTEEVYRREVYGGAASDSDALLDDIPDIVILVRRGWRIVGTGALFLATSTNTLPTEYYFDMDLSELSRSSIVEAGRFASYQSGSGCGRAVLAGIAECLRVEQRSVVLGCSKPQFVAFLERLRLPVELLPGRVVIERVPEKNRSFYIGDDRAVPYVVQYDDRVRAEIEAWGVPVDFPAGLERIPRVSELP